MWCDSFLNGSLLMLKRFNEWKDSDDLLKNPDTEELRALKVSGSMISCLPYMKTIWSGLTSPIGL